MADKKALPWVLGTVLLGTGMAAGAWMLGISPMLDSAAEFRDQADAQAERADQLQIQLTGLKADYERIDEFRADLAVLTDQLPPVIELDAVTDHLDELATGSDVFIRTIASGVAIEVTGPLALAAPVAATETEEGAEEGEEGDESAEAAAPAAEASPSVQGLYAVPIDVTVRGSYANTAAFVKALQSTKGRLIVINNVVSNVQEAAAASGGVPVTKEGDLETVVSMWLLVLEDATAADIAAAEVEGAEVAALPTPKSGDAPITFDN